MMVSKQKRVLTLRGRWIGSEWRMNQRWGIKRSGLKGFEGEKEVGRSWRAKKNIYSFLEITTD